MKTFWHLITSSWISHITSCLLYWFSLVQLSSIAQLCLTLCNPMDCSTPGLPVHHQLSEFTQTLVHSSILAWRIPWTIQYQTHLSDFHFHVIFGEVYMFKYLLT